MKNNKKQKEKISRKAAIKKLGYSAFTAGTMMYLFSNPVKAQSPLTPDLPEEFEW